MTPTDLEAMTKRLLELEAIGFDRQEILPILSAEFKRDISPSDWTALLAYAEDRMSRHDPELAAINRQFNVTLNRMAYIKGVLLGVFQHMVKNYNATLEGKVEHDPDPVTGEVYPVLAVKPLDLAAMAEKIIKLDQEELAALLTYPKHQQQVQAMLGLQQVASGTYQLSALISDDPTDDEPMDVEPVDVEAQPWSDGQAAPS